jgi:hypothetical protein
MGDVFAVRAERVIDGHRPMGPAAVLIRDGVIEDAGDHVVGESASWSSTPTARSCPV